MVQQDSKKLNLSCRESQLLLRVIPLDKKYSEMNPEEQAAVAHYCTNNGGNYGGCLPCKKSGLSKIISREISCKEAIEIWATKPGPFYLGSEVETIREITALEHVWGRRIPRTEEEKESYKTVWEDNVEACKNKPCESLMYYWMQAPLSLFYDGEKETSKQIPFLINVFKEEGWPLDNLLDIQRDRIYAVLDSITKGKKMHDYPNINDGINDVINNINVLQELVKKAHKS